MESRQIVQIVEVGFELAGIAALIIGSVVAVTKFAMALIQGRTGSKAYPALRRGIGNAILLGLELLVAADIIRSVAIEPTIESVAILGLIVLVRTFLSWSLEVEITGVWPWRRAQSLRTAPGSEDDSAP